MTLGIESKVRFDFHKAETDELAIVTFNPRNKSIDIIFTKEGDIISNDNITILDVFLKDILLFISYSTHPLNIHGIYQYELEMFKSLIPHIENIIKNKHP